jgi:two-component system response regulator WspF
MRVAIVNDLRLAVEALKRTVAQAPGCVLAWTAADGAEAVARCAADRPDLVLMDLVMPVLDGVEATRRIMAATPCAILVVTSTVEGNLDRVYNALGAGALDAVQGPHFAADGSLGGVQPVLRRIRTLQRLTGNGASVSEVPVVAPLARGGEGGRTSGGAVGRPALLALGASTGGPEALRTVLKGLSTGFAPPTLIVQHLDAEFVPGFCGWLAAQTGRSVRPATEGDVPAPGVVYVAASRDHLALTAEGALRYVAEPVEQPYRPSVDVLFESLARHAGRPGAAALLTGMGKDGARGLLALRRAGWRTFAQDEATSVVYGMPRAAREAGAAGEVLPLDALGPALEASWIRRTLAAHPPEGR